MQSKAATVAAYLAELPPDRRADVAAVRNVILANLDRDYEEGMQYGMIGYCVPLRVFAAGYHCDVRQPLPFAALAAQKNYIAVYLMGVYCGCDDSGKRLTPEAKWFRDAWLATGKKLDMGKACVRFKTAADAALDVLGEAIRRVPAKVYIERYSQVLARIGKPKAAGVGTGKSKGKPRQARASR
jgi:hypothetical protein